MVEIEWNAPRRCPTTEVGTRLKELDLSVAVINQLYADIDACTDKESLQKIMDDVRDMREVFGTAENVLSTARDRILSRAELL